MNRFYVAYLTIYNNSIKKLTTSFGTSFIYMFSCIEVNSVCVKMLNSFKFSKTWIYTNSNNCLIFLIQIFYDESNEIFCIYNSKAPSIYFSHKRLIFSLNFNMCPNIVLFACAYSFIVVAFNYFIYSIWSLEILFQKLD